MCSEDEIIEELKSYISPGDYCLIDWETIISRRTAIDDNIVKYSLPFANVYLKDDVFYDIEPIEIDKTHETTHQNDFTEEELEIIDVLKHYCSPKDYELNDWKTIISRAVVDENNITKYEISFATIYLDKNNDLYDISPVEIDKPVSFLPNNLSDSDKLKVDAIKRYVLPKHYNLIDWQTVLNRVKRIDDNLYLYPLNVMDLYLDENLNIVEYDRCYIIDNAFYYDFNVHPMVAAEILTFITDLD